MTDTYDWPELRALATRLFGGDAPGPALEADIIGVFEQHPQTVAKAIDRIAEKYAQGAARSPWALLRHEIQRATSPAPNVKANDGTDRSKAIANAEQWIRAAGLHFDRWPEVHDELFGDRGTLRAWRSDNPLTNRLEALWQEHRPSGEQVEADELERAERWLATRPKPEGAAA